MPRTRAFSKYSGEGMRGLAAAARLACWIFLCFSCVNAERLPVKTYTVADGLQRDQVFRIRQDSRGFLWFCTLEGISRFDGVAMTNFTVADGLPDRVVEDFLETSGGTIFIATRKGLARLNPQGVRGSAEKPLFDVFAPDNPRAARILALYEDKSRKVWVGTSDGLYQLIENGGRITFEPARLGEPLKSADINSETIYVKAILEDRRGALWVGTEGNGLFRLATDGKVSRLTTRHGLGDDKIADLLETADGRLWASFRGGRLGGLCLLDPVETNNPVKKCYSTRDGLPNNWVPDLLETGDRKFWLATVSGLCLWQGDGAASVCKTYTEKNDLCHGIDTLAEDKDGNLWLGSTCGTEKIARYGFTTYTEADGLGWSRINSIFENAAGELFASFNRDSRTVSRFDGEKFSLARPPIAVNYSGWGWGQTVFQDSRGAWWIPTGEGLFRSPDATRFEALARAPLRKEETGAGSKEVFCLFEDSRGDVWMATTGATAELWRWERAAARWRDLTREAGFSSYRIGSAFAEDRSGNIWIGASSDNGQSALVRYRNGEFRVFPQSAGAPSGWIRDLFVDSRGRLWIASTNDGVWRLNDPNADELVFDKYSLANGLSSIGASCVTEDEFGRIYIGTWRGIDRLNPETGQIENFSTADGLPASFVETAFRDRQNNLWFTTDAGLARFQPEPVRVRQPPTVLITGLSVEGEPQPVSILGETALSPLDLRSDQRQMTVDFIGLGASLGEKLRYEYRLGDDDWTATGERTLNFANLSAGAYKFEVRAQTADRIYSPPAVVSFRIAPPVWQRWWFLLLAALVSAGLIYLIYSYRLRQLLALERVRTRIATDLHDDIGANLTRISLLSEVARQKAENGSGKLLTAIADIARESVASMNDIVWAIAPEHDSLLDLTRRMRQHAEEVFALRDIELIFNAPASEADLKLSVGVRRDLLLIFKEAVNNAARHSGCARVRIDFVCDHQVLKLQIRDDGKGFDRRRSESDGQGLRSMTRRARSLGGSLVIDSVEERGTSVGFEMSLRNASRV